MIINVSDSAKEELKKVQEEKEKAVRVYIAGQGWGGPSFGLALDEQKEEDLTMDIDGIKFVYEDYLEDGFEKFNIDFNESGFQKGFTVSPHPKTK